MKVFVIKSLKNKKLIISENSIYKNNIETVEYEAELEFELISNKVKNE